jgi:hypothetical protein
MTDFRALCAELIDALQYHREQTRPINRTTEILDRARAALAQPEPQGPTDENLIKLFNENDWNYISPETFLDIARSVLELR